MTALAADRNTSRRDGIDYSYPMAAAVEVFAGGMAALDAAGNVVPVSASGALRVVGRSEKNVDNSAGAIADLSADIRAGVFKFENGDSFTKADIGQLAYALDDQTIMKTGVCPAGIIVDVDTTTTEVWVVLGPAAAKTSIGKVAVVAVSATELRTLAASPKTLIAGVTGKAFIFTGAYIKYSGGASIFDSVGAGEDLAIRYTDGSGAIVSATLDTTTDINLGSITDDQSSVPALATVVNPVPGAALVLDNVGAGELASTDDDSDGDGTITVTLSYDEYTV